MFGIIGKNFVKAGNQRLCNTHGDEVCKQEKSLFFLVFPLKPCNIEKNMAREEGRMPRLVKKTMKLDQDYIDTLRLIFGVRTEKEAVNKALEMAVIDNDIIEAHEEVEGRGT